MNVLKTKWLIPSPSIRCPARFPVSVRLIPSIDCGIQNILSEYPHLTQSRVINDLLQDSLIRSGFMKP